MPPVTSGSWALAIAALAICGVLSMAIAAWLIRELGRAALDKSAQQDVPQVLTALSDLLDKLRLLLPWSQRVRQSPPPAIPEERTGNHARSSRDLSEGAPGEA